MPNNVFTPVRLLIVIDMHQVNPANPEGSYMVGAVFNTEDQDGNPQQIRTWYSTNSTNNVGAGPMINTMIWDWYDYGFPIFEWDGDEASLPDLYEIDWI